VLSSAGAQGSTDTLKSRWAKPLVPTRVSDLLKQSDTTQGAGSSTYVSGSIEDAQAYFNLRNLLASSVPGELHPDLAELAHFRRLLQLLGVDSRLAAPVALRMRSAMLAQANQLLTETACGTNGVVGIAQAAPTTDDVGVTDEVGLDNQNVLNRPLQALDLDWLLDVPGFTPEAVDRLRPYTTILPMRSMININTASAQVLAAMIVGLNFDQAQQLVRSRNQANFLDVNDMANRLGDRPAGLQPDATELDVRSCFFIVHSRIDQQRAHLLSDALLYRDPINHTTQLIRVNDLY